MLKHLTCQTPARFIRLAWLSIQPNGDVSFGLSDKTYISPRFKGRHFVWSMFNRVTAEYQVASDPNALQQVKNPHFTFHAPDYFHLKTDKDRAHKDEALFAGICPVHLVLSQQPEMPWIRATSAPLRQLRSAGLRWSKIPTDDLPLRTYSEDISIMIEVNFVSPNAVTKQENASTWCYILGDVGIRVEASMTVPRIATLSWFHSY